jgi:tripartite-type tricarboxylate transporter receptor subunit TctC
MWGPKRLPRPIVMRWNQAVGKVLLGDEAQTRLKAEGLEPGGGPPERFQQIVRSDVEKWRRVMREANIKPQP